MKLTHDEDNHSIGPTQTAEAPFWLQLNFGMHFSTYLENGVTTLWKCCITIDMKKYKPILECDRLQSKYQLEGGMEGLQVYTVLVLIGLDGCGKVILAGKTSIL